MSKTPIAQVQPEMEDEPTEEEIAIAKFLKRLLDRNTISAIDLGKDFVFPLLKKLAKQLGDHEDQLISLTEEVEAIGQATIAASSSDVFEDARDALLKLANLIDKVMVHAGFLEVIKDVGLKPTEKMPEELKKEYEETIGEVVSVAGSIQEALNTLLNPAGSEPDVSGVPDLDEPAPPEPAPPVAPPVVVEPSPPVVPNGESKEVNRGA